VGLVNFGDCAILRNARRKRLLVEETFTPDRALCNPDAVPISGMCLWADKAVKRTTAQPAAVDSTRDVQIGGRRQAVRHADFWRRAGPASAGTLNPHQPKQIVRAPRSKRWADPASAAEAFAMGGRYVAATTSAGSARMHLAILSGPICTLGGQSAPTQRGCAKPQRGANEQLSAPCRATAGVPGISLPALAPFWRRGR